eukprot:738925-Amorphochlora_amoeboformis.AAC.1
MLCQGIPEPILPDTTGTTGSTGKGIWISSDLGHTYHRNLSYYTEISVSRSLTVLLTTMH